MDWAPIGFNAIYREIIQRRSFTKKKSIYFTRLHGNNTYLHIYREINRIYREITLQGFLAKKN